MQRRPAAREPSRYVSYLWDGTLKGLAETNEALRKRRVKLIVRRELAVNHVYYRKNYDGCDSLPHWAKALLEKH